MGALQYIATSALSLTLAGNTGIGPFLTLFTIGVIEKSDPTLLHMDGWVEKVISSWPGITIFGCLTIVEFVGKCVPVVDAAMDSAITFAVPLLSILGSFASFGLFTAPSSSFATADDQNGNHTLHAEHFYQYDYSSSSRQLSEGETNLILIFLQVILCCFGIILAVLVHLCKLLLRLMGEGCCTCCITIAEYTWIIISVTICIFIVPIAIGTVACLLIAGGFGFKSWWEKRYKAESLPEGGSATNNNWNNQDQEHGKTQQNSSDASFTPEPSINPNYVEVSEK
jgi:hypothetical protein